MEVIVFSLLPAIIYAFIVYLNTPYRSVAFQTGLAYWSVGFISVIFVTLIHRGLPFLNNPLFDPPVGLFFYAFVQIALVEEVCKWLSFRILSFGRQKETDTPMAVMFYCMMSAAGFAVVENYHYAEKFGQQVLFYRTFSSVIVHMTCGAFMGYMIAKGMMNTQITYKSVFEIFLKRNPRWRKTIYTLLGLATATAVHGLYDYVIMIDPRGNEYSILVIIIACLWVSYLAGRKIAQTCLVEEEQ